MPWIKSSARTMILALGVWNIASVRGEASVEALADALMHITADIAAMSGEVQAMDANHAMCLLLNLPTPNQRSSPLSEDVLRDIARTQINPHLNWKAEVDAFCATLQPEMLKIR